MKCRGEGVSRDGKDGLEGSIGLDLMCSTPLHPIVHSEHLLASITTKIHASC